MLFLFRSAMNDDFSNHIIRVTSAADLRDIINHPRKYAYFLLILLKQCVDMVVN